MNLHKATFVNKLAKRISGPLSYIVCINALLKISRSFDAYLNFLMGKGSGAGWGIKKEVEAAILHIHRKEAVVFDIGANLGMWSNLIHQSLPSAQIYLFEPSPTCQNMIRKLALENSKLIPKAVGETIGEAVLYFSSETDEGASLHERGESYFKHHTYKTTKVAVTTIDAIIESENIEFIDFVKMDIEGHELFALNGAKKALEQNKIGALSFEFGSGNVNSRTYFRDFWRLLTDAGYEIFRVTPSSKLVYIDSYYEDLEFFRGVSNYIAKSKKNPHLPKNKCASIS